MAYWAPQFGQINRIFLFPSQLNPWATSVAYVLTITLQNTSVFDKKLAGFDCNLLQIWAIHQGIGERRCVIELKNVGFHYGGENLFDQINLKLEPGSFHFLTGPSGAGKTTLLKLCYGALFATQGQVIAFGSALEPEGRDQTAQARRRIGVVDQDCQFLDHLTVAENVALPLTVTGRHDLLGNLETLLRWVGLGKVAGQLPPSLSGGERQRLALARAVVASPDVILADEPTGNIDWDMSERLLGLLADLNASGKTIVFATHDMPLIRHAKNLVQARVMRLRDGQLQQAGAEL